MTENARSSKIQLRGRSYTRCELELIVDLWSLLRHIDTIGDDRERRNALESWRALRKYLFEP